MAIEIQFVESYKDIAPDLWAACFPLPLEGLFWYETLETCGLSDQFEFFYALIKNGQETIGIAPCFIHNVPMSLVAPPLLARVLETVSKVWPQAGFQRTLFVGSPCADEGTVGLLGGIHLADVIVPLSQAVFIRAKKMRAAMVVFKDCLGSLRSSMSALCSQENYFRIPSFPGADLHLAGDSIEGYFAALAPALPLRKRLYRARH